jgi:DnaK suppressor protein
MLSAQQKAQIRQVLEQDRQKLQRTGQNALSYSMNHERNIGRDSIDESMEEELFSTEMRLHDREKFLLNKINKQLARLDKDEIDVCEDCGEQIAFRRLMARPVTTLCIDCKEQSEREEAAIAQAGRGGGFDAEDTSEEVGSGGGGAEIDRAALGGLGVMDE